MSYSERIGKSFTKIEDTVIYNKVKSLLDKFKKHYALPDISIIFDVDQNLDKLEKSYSRYEVSGNGHYNIYIKVNPKLITKDNIDSLILRELIKLMTLDSDQKEFKKSRLFDLLYSNACELYKVKPMIIGDDYIKECESTNFKINFSYTMFIIKMCNLNWVPSEV